ncbi:SdpI family protein [Kaistella sp. G5-32]|uniref:SdpI family protein n=1 Tax=Kaistella gelatinilytica TaxID=2787636 RepID=A0ABS0FEH6_9FLAO|nr:SdpI family protein [Kaistella gelatinilytica]MBF8458048.1 SdpI family protein [Kaistella gelatinilytica]
MNLKKELPLIAIVLLPFVYIALIWNKLPEKIPVHWNFEGEIDRYGEKIEILLIPILLPLLIYVIFLVIPKIDPKKKLNNMGNKLQTLKFLLTTLMSGLALFIIYSSQSKTSASPNIIFLFIGVLYVVLGNYFKTIKANYFIGIRTPWTLESESIWKETHLLGGKLWLIGGLMVIISALFIEEKLNGVVFLIITGIITVVPAVYSFLLFKRENKTARN